MEHCFWKERWQQNEIGFHMEERHEYLHQYFHRLHVGPETVFVPLCGKSPDLLWLRQQGARVLGVELSEIAVQDFFRENALKVEVNTRPGFDCYRTEGITIFCGDLFDFPREETSDVRGVYDRGALVALPVGMRQDYADRLCRILPADSRILLVSYDYDQTQIPGPPFSVPLPEIESLFGGVFHVEQLVEQDALPSHKILQQRGVGKLTEFACLLTHR